MPETLAFSAITQAADRLHGYASRTPLLQSAALNAATGANVFLKPENLQRTGSFKFRGAFNRLAQLSEAEKRAGVVAWSSGNHAQGVAAAAQILGLSATIVMPFDAPVVKREQTERYGADIVFYDRYAEHREAIGRRLARERGATLVPSYDDFDIMAGQGTAGLELAEDVSKQKSALDALLVCCGGGGLIAGMATAFQQLSPQTKLYSVEPEDFNDHQRSLRSGVRESNAEEARSLCDALLSTTPGELTFPINKALLSGGLCVSDAAVKRAMRFAFESLRLVLEPGGAVALAAALEGALDLQGANVGVVLSGGNVDPALFQSILYENTA
ncbi:MAG: threonine/serine dehydratase [Pseudomonadota bacterium]